MRCFICDYSHDTPSDYYTGLAISHRYRPLLELNNGDIVCQVCYDEGYEDPDYVVDEGEEPVLETDFDNE